MAVLCFWKGETTHDSLPVHLRPLLRGLPQALRQMEAPPSEKPCRKPKEKGLSQKDLEKLSGVKQPVIARMENGTNVPKLDTVIKILAPLGKTLAIVPLKK